MDPITLIEGAASALAIVSAIFAVVKRGWIKEHYQLWKSTPIGKNAFERLEQSINRQNILIETQDVLIQGLQTSVSEQKIRRENCEKNIAQLTIKYDDLKELVTSKASVELLAGSVDSLRLKIDNLIHAVNNGFGKVLQEEKIKDGFNR